MNKKLAILVVLFGLFVPAIKAAPAPLKIEPTMYEAPSVLQMPLRILAQTGGACGTGVQHCTVLNWTASTTQGVTYQVFRGTISGGEGSTAINTVTITGTSFIDPVTITNSPQTFFYTVEAVETTSGITLNSVPSNEVSVTFPGAPAAPTGATGTVH